MARKSRKQSIIEVNVSEANAAGVAQGDSSELPINTSTEHINTSTAHIDDNNFTFETRTPTAIYARLSMEDNGEDSSDSIDTQVRLVREFVEKQEKLTLVNTFIDNGYTGTNFDRPQFKAMMEKVKTGAVRCIVVKDLSRFGRNYVELGYYIETLFPLLNVRLIAVNDNFDSFRPSDRDSLSLPIKNMVNEAYAKDVSRKQGSVMKMRREMGIHRMPFAPYGYRFNEHRQLIRDEETAPYVRMIFSWAIAGLPRSVIAKRLRYMNIPTPMAILHGQGLMVNKNDGGWTEHTVKGILSNPVYAGTLAMGRTKQSLCDGIKPISIERKDWVCVEGKHEQIVSRMDYSVIEGQIEENRKRIEERKARNAEKREGLDDCFKGMVFCAECGRPMPFERGSHSRANIDNPAFGFYRCISRKKDTLCKSQRVQQNLLKIIVADQIRETIAATVDRKKLLEKIKRDEIPDNRIRYYKRFIKTKKQDAERAGDKLTALYADFSDGLLEEDDYQSLKEKAIAEAQNLREEARKAEIKLLEMQKAVDNYILQAKNMEKFLENAGFNEAVTKELVERIEVDSGNKVTVVFRSSDVLENSLVEECLDGMA